MIEIGGVKPNALYVGANAVSRVYHGETLVWSGQMFVDGIPLFIDNARYESGSNRRYTDTMYDTNRFIAIIDTKTPERKSVSFGYQQSFVASGGILVFNEHPANGQISDDYWSFNGNRTVTSVGRYWLVSIEKESAKYFYLKNDATGEYYAKGNAVE